MNTDLDLILAPFGLHPSQMTEALVRSGGYDLLNYQITFRRPPVVSQGFAQDLPPWILGVEWTYHYSIDGLETLDLSFSYAYKLHEKLYFPSGRNWFKA
jgi:hypothetical protein